ncbi:hypothetical protein [Pseudoalteromonas luteoviolacea]|uniref:hypothetical protein n=1 Tax=Pseudoalteromonas luteoviolacea TaxID=43657 RepID=UPI001B37A3BE|nr:hypothetical protein [Pseudoalteromonas luteoviolacea]MBQ4839006.1 hypothetical protein [Pseudoalteromonas luteoviolacea]
MAKKLLSALLLGVSAVPTYAESADALPEAFELMYKCGDSEFRENLESHYTVFESIEGVKAFLKLKLPSWAFSMFNQVAQQAYEQHLKQEVSLESIESARVYFFDTLRVALVDRAKQKGLKVGDCEMEIADIIDELNRNKAYLLYNNSFHNFFMQANIPLAARGNNGVTFLLVLMAMPQASLVPGICKTYRQQGARGTAQFSYCN